MSENGLDSGFGHLSIPENPVRNRCGDKLHHKFAVIDNRTVITGSFNWSPSAAHTTDETLLVIDSPEVAAHFTREMNRLWRGAELGITPRMQRRLERRRAQCGSGTLRSTR